MSTITQEEQAVRELQLRQAHPENEDPEDPKDQETKTRRQARIERAREEIPSYVKNLIDTYDEQGDLSKRDVRLLYDEYRQYYGSPRSFRMHISHAHAPDIDRFADWTVVEILRLLRVPSVPPRRLVLSALCALWEEVTVHERERKYALK